MTQLDGSILLVVGASGVLGRELTTRLTDSGARVLGTSGSEATLPSIPVGASERLVCNLRDNASIDAMCAQVRASVTRLDGLIVAAGVVAFGPFRETPPEVVEHLMRVNTIGPLRAIRHLADLMTGGVSPFILTLSGKVAEIPTSGLAAYSASKSALYAAASAASRELRRDGIRWCDARPGHTETGLADRAIFGTAPAFGAGLSAAHVADRLIAAIENDEKDLPSDAF